MVNPYKKEAGKEIVLASYQRLLEQWGVPYQEAEIQTTFGLTHVIQAGETHNAPLFLFHGVGDNSALMWIYNIAELSRHFAIYAIDTIGGPGKSVPNDRFSRDFDQASWIDKIREHYGLDRVNLAGVSNGSYLASYYTIRYPARVDRMVGMAGGVKVNVLRTMLFFLPEALFPVSDRTTRRLFRKMCAPSRSTVFEDHPEILSHWTYLLTYFNNRAMMRHKYRIFKEEELAILREKALYLIGEYDRMSNYPGAIRELEHNRICYKIIPDAGHGINLEQAATVNEELIRYFSDNR